MRFLIDAQLPRAISYFFVDKGFDSKHVQQLSEGVQSSDQEIAKVALLENRIVVTKDNDFVDSFMLLRIPSKILFVTTGNIVNKELVAIFEKNFQKIIESFENSSYLELSNNELIEHQ